MNLPAWNIESEYPTLTSPEFQADEHRTAAICQEVAGLIEKIRPQLSSPAGGAGVVETLQKILLLNLEYIVLGWNLGTYVSCLESTDAKDEAAKSKASELQSARSHYFQVFKPVHLYMSTCDQSVFEQVVAHPELKASKFTWEQERTLRDTLLSEKEETLLTALSNDGFKAWSNMYFAISGTLKVSVELNGKTEEIGLAQAAGMTRSSNEAERKAAWLGIQKAWKGQEEAAAAVLNSLAGWRLELVKKRSHTRPVNALTSSLFQSRIKQETLDAMMKAVALNRKEIQNAAFMMAKLHGKSKLDPWDLLAPAPIKKSSGGRDFSEGLALIRKAFGGVNEDFGNFVDLMMKNQWIEARVLPNKASGAHCTAFVKSRTPRVFQTYLGSNNDISTLAHELGHAYHSWVMRDLSLDEQDYPMTLAETASIFAETVLMDEMIEQAKTKEEKLEFAYANVEGAVNLLLNIPARFEFESQFYEKRKERALSARELSEVTDQSWSKWYGETLSENDKMFWATKLHFSMAEVSFYNYPYTFGYLFALSIYARRQSLGKDFWPKYTAILRDTGRMTAEALIQKHLGENIEDPEFWQKAIDVVKGKIGEFKQLVQEPVGGSVGQKSSKNLNTAYPPGI